MPRAIPARGSPSACAPQPSAWSWASAPVRCGRNAPCCAGSVPPGEHLLERTEHPRALVAGDEPPAGARAPTRRAVHRVSPRRSSSSDSLCHCAAIPRRPMRCSRLRPMPPLSVIRCLVARNHMTGRGPCSAMRLSICERNNASPLSSTPLQSRARHSAARTPSGSTGAVSPRRRHLGTGPGTLRLPHRSTHAQSHPSRLRCMCRRQRASS